MRLLVATITSMSELVFIVEEDPTGGLTAQALGHSIFTEAEDHDELLCNIREAVECHVGDDESRDE